MNENIILIGSILLIASVALAIYLNYQEKHSGHPHQ